MNPALKQSLAAAALTSLVTGPAIAQSVTLDVTAWKGNETEPAGLPELIARFEEEHPDIDVELSYIGRLDTDTVIPPRLQGGNPPDVMMTDLPLVKVWGNAGLLTDLGTDSEWYGRIDPVLKDELTSGEAIYVMPLETIGMGNYVNMALLRQVGIEEAPLTVEELKTTCRALVEGGIDPLVFTGGFSAPLFLIANGLAGSDDSAVALGEGDASFAENESFNAGMDLIRELIEVGCVDPAKQAGLDPWSTALNEFTAGNFAMMPQGAWNISTFDKVDGLDYVFAPIPADNDTGVAMDIFGIGWSIASQGEQQEAARTFVDWFAEPEQLQVLLDAESAYTPFDDGASGTPELAAPYDTARENGGVILYPFSVLQWPKSLEKEVWDSMTGFLLDTSMSNEDVLNRWDETVEDDF